MSRNFEDHLRRAFRNDNSPIDQLRVDTLVERTTQRVGVVNKRRGWLISTLRLGIPVTSCTTAAGLAFALDAAFPMPNELVTVTDLVLNGFLAGQGVF